MSYCCYLFYLVLFYFVPLLILNPVIGQTNDDTNLNKNWSYCFEFTWFGPGYDNYSRYNGTCTDYLDETRAENIPCKSPVVISYDGTPPDIDYLWKNHRASVLCKRAKNQVCAKYSYIYNGEVNNATYMCTKVMAVGEGAVTDGCFETTHDGYTIEMCVCESTPGLYRPCNSSAKTCLSSILLFVILWLTWNTH